MATIITRETGGTAKGSPLTNAEIDSNFININTEAEANSAELALVYKDFPPQTDGNVTPQQGRVWYNKEAGSLDVAHNSEVVQQIGQEIYLPNCYNNTGVTIPNGTFVMLTGVQGDNLIVAPANTTGAVLPEMMLGFTTESIANNAIGKVTSLGLVRGVDLGMWAVGTKLYPDHTTPGGITNVQPSPPNFRVPLAIVVRSGATGWIYVRINASCKFGSAQCNVSITSPSEGDYLYFNGTYWENRPGTTESTSDPSSTDDINSGFKLFDEWLNITTSTFFKCADNTASAAVWKTIG